MTSPTPFLSETRELLSLRARLSDAIEELRAADDEPTEEHCLRGAIERARAALVQVEDELRAFEARGRHATLGVPDGRLERGGSRVARGFPERS